jgi:renalase
MTVVVIGAGLAGLACARVLHEAGVEVVVYEREQAPGGRFTSVLLDGRPVDIGAAYFTVSDPAFEAVVARWHERSLARPWTKTFQVYPRSGAAASTGPMRWSAPGGLRSLAEDLAAGLPIRYGVEVTQLPPADTVVLAMPRPEAARLTGVPELPERAWSSVHTVVLRYPTRSWPDFHGAFVNDHPVLSTVCDDGDRRGDGAPVLVAHAAPDTTGDQVAEAVGELLGIADGPDVETFRWPYARPDAPLEGPFAVERGVALAGDEYGPARAQTAWLSGRALGLSMV